METRTKHTPGVVERRIYGNGSVSIHCLHEGGHTELAVVEAASPLNGVEHNDAANAARFVLTWNTHDELVAALKEMVEQYGGLVDGGVEEPAALTVDHAKAALAKASA